MTFVICFICGVLVGAGIMGILANIWGLRITRFFDEHVYVADWCNGSTSESGSDD